MTVNEFRTGDGRLVTAKTVERLADEAERGYDLSKLEWRRTGRPSLSESGESPRVQYRVAAATYLRAKQRAEEEGMPTISALSRALLEAYADGRVKLPHSRPKPAVTAVAKRTAKARKR